MPSLPYWINIIYTIFYLDAQKLGLRKSFWQEAYGEFFRIALVCFMVMQQFLRSRNIVFSIIQRCLFSKNLTSLLLVEKFITVTIGVYIFGLGVFSQTGYLLIVTLLFGGDASAIAPLLGGKEKEYHSMTTTVAVVDALVLALSAQMGAVAVEHLEEIRKLKTKYGK